MSYIQGKYKKSIFEGNNGYLVGLFRVRESSEDIYEIVNNRTVTFTGSFPSLNTDDTYILYGEYIYHEKFGYQFKVDTYERVEPKGEDAIIEFLTSDFVKGCGEKRAKQIVNVLGEDAIKLIKEDINNLYKCDIPPATAKKIYDSITNYYDLDETIIYLTGLGFSVKEINKIIAMYGKNAKKAVELNLYSFVDFVDFDKLDSIYFKMFEDSSDMRIKACIIETMKRLTFETGDTYSSREEISEALIKLFDVNIYDTFDDYMSVLEEEGDIIHKDNRYYLIDLYEDEMYIARELKIINSRDIPPVADFPITINDIQKEYGIKYDDEQINAIKSALENPVTLITGGPGTGKTTIINGILNTYKETYQLSVQKMRDKVILLAPTGRASKRMSEATLYPASTIHRFLKYSMDTKEFQINEHNKVYPDLVIVDEVSMIDTNLFASLLKGIDSHVRLILVGDEFQLPSVSPGNILKDLIESDYFNYINLTTIYRQSDNSFIPILASEIKKQDIESDISLKKDDYNFLPCTKLEIRDMIKEIVSRSVKKGLSEKEIQILAPMYKGENGIDNLNIILQKIFNPEKSSKKEVTIGSVVFRENDKVLNLVNNVENNIFNGDIGYIKKIDVKSKEDFMVIDFYGNRVSFKREDISSIRHAYAMTIHKSQGSEFDHVIMPLTMEYIRMLYNKLIYTGVSRAKKSLVLVGDPRAFMMAVNNNNSLTRKTTLKEDLDNVYNDTSKFKIE